MKKSLLVALMLSAGIASSFAAPIDLTSTASVTTGCTFGTPTDGSMAVDTADVSVLKTTTGSEATLPFTYTGTPTITVGAPQVTAPGASPSTAVASAKAGSNTFTAEGSGAKFQFLSGSAETLKVSNTLTWATGTSVPVGAYTVKNTITCQ